MGNISIKNVHKNYGQLNVLKEFSLDIEDGEFVVLVGPSGCGKSTILKILAGLEPASGGSIEIGGRDVTDLAPGDRDIAMVFQNYALYPHLTVAQNIGFGLKMRKMPQSEIDKRVLEAARTLAVDPYLNRRPKDLSGGQRQRVAMGRALVRDPKLFLFDEPLSNLDAKLRVEMRTEIKKLHQSLGASMVYVTHDQIEAMTLATKIVVMKSGVIQQIGTPAEIYNRPANLFVADFMGSPAMNLVPASTSKTSSGFDIIIRRVGEDPLVLSDTKARDLPSEVMLGLRPEDITDGQFRNGSAKPMAPCKVSVVEPAGADTFVVLSLGGKEVTARLQAETSAEAGKSMEFCFDLNKASYFDRDTGHRLSV